ncbi:hypothetical protein AB0M10_15250 [Streptomyces sp. NPDC051840]|uniref:hypothetical protein n=1 Tax=Streptomyces sp. NPDC051840 TaxID=3154752 RepID=UPI00342F24C5
MDNDFAVLRHDMDPRHGSAPTQPLTGEEANIQIRGTVVNSLNDEVWTYEVPDREGIPLRIVARTRQGSEFQSIGQRTVREVYEQQVTGPLLHECDWLERREYQAPKPKRQPVKVGDTVSAMPDGYSLATGEVTSVEWKRRPMQSHHELPPLWTWEWRVEIKFPDGRTREGRWHSDWISKA